MSWENPGRRPGTDSYRSLWRDICVGNHRFPETCSLTCLLHWKAAQTLDSRRDSALLYDSLLTSVGIWGTKTCWCDVHLSYSCMMNASALGRGVRWNASQVCCLSVRLSRHSCTWGSLTSQCRSMSPTWPQNSCQCLWLLVHIGWSICSRLHWCSSQYNLLYISTVRCNKKLHF